jgi:DnaJ family protein C protein 28
MIEDIIREAMERGDFDNLPGKGRPLHLTRDPLLDPLTAIVHRILLDNGVSHPLIEARRGIAAEAEEIRGDLRSAWQFYQRSHDEEAWSAAMLKFRARVKEINREVRIFNLKTPSPALHGLAIDSDEEISHVTAERNRATHLTSTNHRSR